MEEKLTTKDLILVLNVKEFELNPILTKLQSDLFHFWLKVEGQSSRIQGEQMNIGYKGIQASIRSGKEIFEALYSIFKLIEVKLVKDDKLLEYNPHLIKFNALCFTDEQIKKEFEEGNISEVVFNSIVKFRKEHEKPLEMGLGNGNS